MYMLRGPCLRGPYLRYARLDILVRSMAVTTQLSEYASRQLDSAVVDFSAGQPSPALLPLAKVHAAAAHRLSLGGDAALLLQYGPRQGYPSFRQDLAAFLSSRYQGHVVDADSLIATAGVSHGLDLACRCFSQPGDTILAESPTYFLAAGIFKSNHLTVHSLATDDEGIDVDALERLLSTWPQGKARPRLLYTVPVHNNPRATTLPPHRRHRLVQLAHQYDFTILADEVYQMLTFPGSPEPPPPLRWYELQMFAQQQREPKGGPQGPALQRRSRVVSLGSFSKILAPGLRLGWIETGADAMDALRTDGAINSGGCIASLACGVAHSALQLGLLQEHLDTQVKPALAGQSAALTSALRQHLPQCAFLEPQGGYFIWLQLPEKVLDAKLLLAHAERAQLGVRFTPGATCGGPANFARLCFAFYSSPEMEQGVLRLAQAIATY